LFEDQLGGPIEPFQELPCQPISVELNGVGAGQSAFLALECAIFLFGRRMGHDRFDPRRLAALWTSGPRRRHRGPDRNYIDHTGFFPHRVHDDLFGADVDLNILDAAAGRGKSIFNKGATLLRRHRNERMFFSLRPSWSTRTLCHRAQRNVTPCRCAASSITQSITPY
jgi:hypothetical protein